MQLISRARAAPPPVDELEEDVSGSMRRRRMIIRVLIAAFLIIPAVAILASQGFTGRAIFVVPGTVVFIALVEYVALGNPTRPGSVPPLAWFLLPAISLLGVALFVVGGMNWLTALAVVAAALGRYAPSYRSAAISEAGCAALGLGISLWLQVGYGNAVSATIVPPLAGFLAYSAERRNYLIYRLKETRAELARMAVADERLRIARDLHDLLGHSLSLIALKAELAGRTVGSDPVRAAQEIADLETVARRSLAEVRQAVTSYRQPTLAAELAAARRMLASAGIDCRVEAPTTYSLPPEMDALLAWTVREGATNIVRHASAQHATICIKVTSGEAGADISDDGTGPAGTGPAGTGPAGTGRAGTGAAEAGSAGAGPGSPGTGLAGLAERADRVGGVLSAGGGSRGGFRLRVSVPLPGAAGTPAAAPAQLRAGETDAQRVTS